MITPLNNILLLYPWTSVEPPLQATGASSSSFPLNLGRGRTGGLANPSPEELASAYARLERIEAAPWQLQTSPGAIREGIPQGRLLDRSIGLQALNRLDRNSPLLMRQALPNEPPQLPTRLSSDITNIAVTDYTSAAKAQALLASETFARAGLKFSLVGTGPQVIQNADGTWIVTQDASNRLSNLQLGVNSILAQEGVTNVIDAGPVVTNDITAGLQRNPGTTITLPADPSEQQALLQGLPLRDQQALTLLLALVQGKLLQNRPILDVSSLFPTGSEQKTSSVRPLQASPFTQQSFTSTSEQAPEFWRLVLAQQQLQPQAISKQVEARVLASPLSETSALGFTQQQTQSTVPQTLPIWRQMDGYLPPMTANGMPGAITGDSQAEASQSPWPQPASGPMEASLQADVMSKRQGNAYTPQQAATPESPETPETEVVEQADKRNKQQQLHRWI